MKLRLKSLLNARVWTGLLMSVTFLLIVANINLAFAHQWGSWHWHKRNIGVLNTAFYRVSSTAAMNDWGPGFNVINPRSVTHHSDVSFFDGNFGDTGWGGLASIESYFNHCHYSVFGICFDSKPGITHAHARLNTYYFWSNLNTGTTADSGRGVQCQELGHTFGLDHSNDGCMGKGYFNNLNYVTSHSDSDLNAMYSGTPLGDCAGGCF